MKKLSDDRNGTAIFAERVEKNLAFVVTSATAGYDVHPVTQAVSSLLGIIIFPWEHSAFDQLKRKKLPVLVVENSWPAWKMSGNRRVLEVQDLVHVLRNCVAHGRIEFDSDVRDPTQVRIRFTHVPDAGQEPDWIGEIPADQLITFCRRFLQGMKGLVD